MPTYLLCGNDANIYGFFNENTGPSDGIIFVSSCTDTLGIGNVAGTSTKTDNHMEPGWESSAWMQVKTWLG